MALGPELYTMKPCEINGKEGRKTPSKGAAKGLSGRVLID